MLLKDWLVAAKKQVPSMDAELLLLWALNQNSEQPLGRAELFLLAESGDAFLDEKTRRVADNALLKRIEGMPLAYIFGEKEFYGRNFSVNQQVLIPRPETETIIDLLKEDPAKYNKYTLLDIGTGSGCIAITAWLEMPQLKAVFATDVSKAAIKMAEKNMAKVLAQESLAKKFQTKIRFCQADLLQSEKLMQESNFRDEPVIVVANLPYVDQNWNWLDRKSLSYEPELALFAGQGGLEKIYQLIEQFITNCCKKYNNYLYLEADVSQHDDIIKHARDLGLWLVQQRGYILNFEARSE